MAYTSDFLIIGSGISGLLLALKAARKGSVILVTKQDLSKGSTKRAQGGITAVISPHDSVEQHVADTLETGNGLSDKTAVELVSTHSAALIEELLDYGVPFSRNSSSTAPHGLSLGREGGHGVHRIVHARDHTGQTIQETLTEQVQKTPGITILTWHTLVDLITDHHRHTSLTQPQCCYGAYLYDRSEKQFHRAVAGQTIIATGGIGKIYEHTTNPSVATGDGIAAAWRAGCAITNMEFVQFHPTTLYHPRSHSFLISEAVRGFGARLLNSNGEEFMHSYHPMGELAPRDIVARAIDREMKLSGSPCVYLEILDKDPARVARRFPKISAKCTELGISIPHDVIPVVPASHYSCGGIHTNHTGMTEIENLFACGEAAYTGVHGANRLASNSLLEAGVFATIIGETLEQKPRCPVQEIPPWDDSNTANTEEWVLISHNKTEIQKIMSDYVGIVRTNERLTRALKRIILLREEIEHFYKRTKITTSLLELRNMGIVAELVIRAARQRRESRGLHFNRDYPEKDPAQAQVFSQRKET
ncbi:L-aspartate oxidase [Chitinivibrio alkaliphilus]|uniref:L-aspartate oxidase n=1 Tax=Chitinivibrio alkaliphilus ACht1 TaxID=1313304 RepID=U7DC78_9BACT|nr:L-aspartate oxidase [Chitinivibrio alkaliphilus]ERP32025.1 L-aspartate oxidase [Chitinivibrio alkaliphilus ACht1]